MDPLRTSTLRSRLEAGPPLLFDGAIGTEIERRGIPCGLPLWSTHALLEQPDSLGEIHSAYAAAGAEVLTANTFRTQRHVLANAGRAGQAGELTRLAVGLARDAADGVAGRRVWVAGSAPSLEDCYRPDLVPSDAILAREHADHAARLAEAGVDLILAETLNTIREAVAAARAGTATGLPLIVSFVCNAAGHLLSGEPLGAAVAAVLPFSPSAVGVNCVPPSAVPGLLPPLAESGAAFGVCANLGAPGAAPSAPRAESASPAEFAAHARDWRAAGARYLGGCCGTEPHHIAALAGDLAGDR